MPGLQPQSSPSGGVQNIDDPNPDESDQIEEEKQQQEKKGEEDVDDFEDDIQVETDEAFSQGTQDLNDLDPNHVDNTKDAIHPGPRQHKIYADQLINLYNKLYGSESKS